MIALGPPGALKRVGAKGNDDNRHEQSEEGNAVDSEDRDVMGDIDGIRNAGKRGIGLRLKAQIVAAGRDARDHDGVILLALGPGPIAAVAGVAATLPTA